MDMTVNLPAAAVELVVPLRQLIPSPKNARRTVNYRKNPPTALAASMKVLGVLQNLVVTKAPDDKYFVDVGERRRQALLLLARGKAIDLEPGALPAGAGHGGGHCVADGKHPAGSDAPGR